MIHESFEYNSQKCSHILTCDTKMKHLIVILRTIEIMKTLKKRFKKEGKICGNFEDPKTFDKNPNQMTDSTKPFQ